MCALKALTSTVYRVSKGFKMSQISSTRPFLVRTWEFSPRHLCQQPERSGFSNHTTSALCDMFNSFQLASATSLFILSPTSWFQNVLRRRPQGLACGQVCSADPKTRLGETGLLDAISISDSFVSTRSNLDQLGELNEIDIWQTKHSSAWHRTNALALDEADACCKLEAAHPAVQNNEINEEVEEVGQVNQRTKGSEILWNFGEPW